MTPAEVIKLFRHEVADTALPYLWSKTEVDSFLDDAQNMLCRLIGGLRDSTSDAATLTLTAGEAWTTIHPAVLNIRGAVLASTGRPVSVFNYDDLYSVQAVPRALPFDFSKIDLAGPVQAIILGMEEGKAKVVQIPTADDQLKLLVERLPLVRPSIAGNLLEVREEHHRHLVIWMKALAYGKHDADTYDKDRSEMYMQDFGRYCSSVVAEKARSEHKPRLINYGGL